MFVVASIYHKKFAKMAQSMPTIAMNAWSLWCVIFACILAQTTSQPINVDKLMGVARSQYATVHSQWKQDPKGLPDHAYPTEKAWTTTSATGWTSGFAGGTLWNIYEHTGDATVRGWADDLTRAVAAMAHDTSTHDVGFVIMSTYGNAYRLTHQSDYLPVIRQAAESLSTRYSPIVRCTRSWNKPPNTGFWVIIDNMMNLELLFAASRLFKNDTWYDMAFQHANRTMIEHFRPDSSSYHVIRYNEKDGSVIAKQTAQGYADWSTWSRGQSWAIHGFAIAFENTRHQPFLDRSIASADLFLKRLYAEVNDSVPYWDFDAPANERPRDASAAANTAAGLLKLNQFLGGGITGRYFLAAEQILENLSSYSYFIPLHAEYPLPALLDQSVGNLPGHSEISVALSYADYYFTQALNLYETTRLAT